VLLVLISALLMLGTGLLVHDQGQAAETRVNSVRVRPQVDLVAQMLSNDRDLEQARILLEKIAGPLNPDLQSRVSGLQRELQLVKELDTVRFSRLDVIDGRFDVTANFRRVEAAYERMFQDAGFAVAVEDALVAGTRIRSMTARRQVVAALDDWAACCKQSARVKWLWLAARQADPDPSGWRERFRDPTVDRPPKLQQLADDVEPARQPVHLLVALAEEMHLSGLDSLPFLRRAQQVYPGDFWVNFRLGDGLLERQPQEGIRYLQAALAVRPQAAVVHAALGRALASGGRLAEARDCFLAATRIEPGYASAHKDLGRAYLELGEQQNAQSELETAVRLDPADSRSHMHLGSALLDCGRVDAAITELQQAIHLAPKDAENHHWIGKALDAAGRPNEARSAYETMHRLAEDGLRELMVQNRLDEALAATTRAAALEPRSAGSICELGDCLARLGRRDKAAAEFRSALALEPGNEYARGRLRGLLVALGHQDEALAIYEQAVAERPEDPQAWDGYAELCLYLGRTDAYNRLCARILERFGASTDPRASELAARVCLLLPRDASVLQQATATIDRCMAAEPASRASRRMNQFHLTNALARYRAGRFDDAIAAIADLELGDLGPAPLFVIAMASRRTGKTERARSMLGMADLLFDWRPAQATDRLDWLKHVLRREAEELIAPYLPDLLAGRRQAADDEDRAHLLAGCCVANQNARAARLYAELLPRRSKMGEIARQSPCRAACLAAAASAGIGDDAAALDEAGRAQCRAWARQWLSVELTAKAAELGVLRADRRQQLASALRFWIHDPELAPLRDPVALQSLPEAEREECRRLWDRLAALLTPAGGSVDAEQSAPRPAATSPPTDKR
jgi:serine/threonine-protein kinase